MESAAPTVRATAAIGNREKKGECKARSEGQNRLHEPQIRTLIASSKGIELIGYIPHLHTGPGGDEGGGADAGGDAVDDEGEFLAGDVHAREQWLKQVRAMVTMMMVMKEVRQCRGVNRAG